MVIFSPVELFLSYSLIGVIIISPIILLVIAIIIAVAVKRKGDTAEAQSKKTGYDTK